MIEVNNLYAGYEKKEVLQGVNVRVKEGTITTILGANGSGKSTLLKALTGVIPVQDGEILIAGKNVCALDRMQRARLTAYLPQSKNTPDITVGRLVLHGRFPYLNYPRRYSAGDIEIASAAMEKMGVLQWEHVPVSELSGGMRQRVYLAMILAQQSPVIMMDEPTTYLDLGQQIKFTQLLRSLTQQRKTCLLVLHDILLSLKISDYLCVMDQGKIVESGTPQEVLSSGVLNELFGVQIGWVETQRGKQYHYFVD